MYFCLTNSLINSEQGILQALEGTFIYFALYLVRKDKHKTIKL